MSENNVNAESIKEQETRKKKGLFSKKDKAIKTSKVVKTPKKPKKEKEAKFPKLPKIKISKVNTRLKNKEKDTRKKNRATKPSGVMLFSIRNKIVVCFVVPMIFMVIIGFSSYNKAADGMSQKYQESTLETIKMATEYMDMSASFIKAEAVTYAFDEELNTYYNGMLKNDKVASKDVLDKAKKNMTSSKSANQFINNIHIITTEGITMASSKYTSDKDGIFNAYKEVVVIDDKNIKPWIDVHPELDAHLGVTSDDYILAYEMLSQYRTACVVVDIKKSAVSEFLKGLNLGEGSIVGFVTENGREVIVESLPEGQESSLTEGEKVFYGQEFFGAIGTETDEIGKTVLAGTMEVDYRGEDYLFIYSKSEETAATMCALVPIDVVIGQANDIREMTVTLILVASVIALFVGVTTVTGIQNNMQSISRKFGEVAKGDLTVQVTAKGKDEFRGLAGSATNMITNTKKLVNKVSNATGELEETAKNVNEVSGVIDEYSRDITQAISDINEGMSRQSAHAQECVTKTDILSNEIQEVGRVVEQVEKLVGETEEMINKGMEIVQVLGNRAEETTDITAKVGESIDALRKESQIINSFVQTITDISEQTNLLSLNASIEAARAGEAGRGFAVVAEEIRKLADDSAKAAGEISNNVNHIGAQTQNSVESANQARAMVDLQSQAVVEVIEVFREMQVRMNQLVDGLKDIVNSIERADSERNDTVAAVKNISDIIEETAGSAETVNEVAGKLLKNVENLNRTAEVLNENMDGLKTEISVFKI